MLFLFSPVLLKFIMPNSSNLISESSLANANECICISNSCTFHTITQNIITIFYPVMYCELWDQLQLFAYIIKIRSNQHFISVFFKYIGLYILLYYGFICFFSRSLIHLTLCFHLDVYKSECTDLDDLRNICY